MPVTVPIRDTKDTAKFSQTVHNAGGPVAVTKNGYSDYIALTPEEYDSLRYRANMADLYAKLLVSERQGASGAYTDFAEFRDNIREHYDL